MKGTEKNPTRISRERSATPAERQTFTGRPISRRIFETHRGLSFRPDLYTSIILFLSVQNNALFKSWVVRHSKGNQLNHILRAASFSGFPLLQSSNRNIQRRGKLRLRQPYAGSYLFYSHSAPISLFFPVLQDINDSCNTDNDNCKVKN